MKLILLIGIILAFAFWLPSCETDSYKDYDFFSAVDGVIVGDPVMQKDGTWYLPIKLETAVLHSAIALDKIETKRRGDVITIRAFYILIEGGRKAANPKGVSLGRVPDGRYEVKYLNRDVSTSFIQSIVLDRYK